MDNADMIKRETGGDGKPAVLPFYLLLDVSYSMHADIGDLNRALVDFKDELAKDFVLKDIVRLSVLDFSDDANVVVPLCHLPESALPPLSVRGGTSYAAAFRKVRDVINADFDAARNAPFRYFRPAVFFLTDGQPTDADAAWQAAFRDLTYFDKNSGQGFKRYPLFVPFGFRDADARVLGQLAHPKERSRLYFARQGATASSILAEMGKVMTQTVISSGYTAATGGAGDAQAAPQHVLADPTGSEVDAYDGGDFPE